MKKVILILTAVVLTVVGYAQEKKHKRKTAEERTELMVTKMKTDLALTNEQASKVKPVILKREQQRDEWNAQADASRAQRKQAAKETNDELKKILTPEQISKLEQHRKEMRRQRVQQQN